MERSDKPIERSEMDTLASKVYHNILYQQAAKVCALSGEPAAQREKALASEHLFPVPSSTFVLVELRYFSAPIVRLEKPPAGLARQTHSMEVKERSISLKSLIKANWYSCTRLSK